MSAIGIKDLTKDYGGGKGIFDVTLSIERGEAYGYLGPNGAGKSTTMRHLMGFIRAQRGEARIEGMDCWTEQKKIQPSVGYLPGEICFPDDMTGLSYLKLIAAMRHMDDFSYAEKLLELFEMDPGIRISRMSKGMKQKIGIVAAFMHEPDILLLDEPTSGLDPLMQKRFIELIRQEKEKGRTILLSSHIFDEVEKTCDRVGMIRAGRLIRQITVDEMRRSQLKTYDIGFSTSADLERAMRYYPDAECSAQEKMMTVSIADEKINDLIRVLSGCGVKSFREEKHTLEEYFMRFYGGDSDAQYPVS